MSLHDNLVNPVLFLSLSLSLSLTHTHTHTNLWNCHRHIPAEQQSGVEGGGVCVCVCVCGGEFSNEQPPPLPAESGFTLDLSQGGQINTGGGFRAFLPQTWLGWNSSAESRLAAHVLLLSERLPLSVLLYLQAAVHTDGQRWCSQGRARRGRQKCSHAAEQATSLSLKQPIHKSP